jgi:succinate dehydrogenase (ubiquinone) flavoprotein subunit
VHGANRLGANSLLDIVVFGRACANRVEATLKKETPHKPLPRRAGEQTIAELDRLRYAKGKRPTAEIRNEMQRVMQNDAAVFRTGETLKQGVKAIDECNKSMMTDIKTTDRSLVW